MDKQNFYRLKELREGVPLHVAEEYLAKHLNGKRLRFNREVPVRICMDYAFPGSANRPDFIGWDKAFQASINILKAAANENPSLVDKIFKLVPIELADHNSNINLNYKKIYAIEDQKGDAREPFRIVAEFYKDLYEGYYRCISTIFVLSKIILNKLEAPKDLQVFVNQDSKVKIKLLTDDTGNPVPALPELTMGCEANLRNSIAHLRYRKSGRKEFYMWDEISGKKTWEATHTVKSLKEKAMILVRTTRAMDLAVIVYTENKFCNKAGILTIPPGQYDDALIEKIVEGSAVDMQLYSEMSAYDDKNDSRTVSILVPKNHTIPQVRKIMEGPPSYRQFEIPVSVVEKTLSPYLGAFITQVAGVLQSYSFVRFEIEDEEKGVLGNFVLKKEDLKEAYKAKSAKLVHEVEKFNIHKIKLTITGSKREV